MQDSAKIGCFGTFVLALAVYFLWIATLYVGIPLAVAGGVAAYQISKKAREDDALDRKSRNRRLDSAFALYGGSFILFCASLAGNIFSDEGPFKQSSVESAEASPDSGPEKVSVSPELCADLRAEPQIYSNIQAACYRMYPSDSWGDSASRAVCESKRREELDACGIKLIMSPF